MAPDQSPPPTAPWSPARLLPTSQHRPTPPPPALAPPPAPFGETGTNRALCSALFGRTVLKGKPVPLFGPVWLNKGHSVWPDRPGRTEVLRSIKQDRTEGFRSAKQGRMEALRLVLFGQTMPGGRRCRGIGRRWGPRGWGGPVSGSGRCWGRGRGDREGDGRRRVSRSGKGTKLERRWEEGREREGDGAGEETEGGEREGGGAGAETRGEEGEERGWFRRRDGRGGVERKKKGSLEIFF